MTPNDPHYHGSPLESPFQVDQDEGAVFLHIPGFEPLPIAIHAGVIQGGNRAEYRLDNVLSVADIDGQLHVVWPEFELVLTFGPIDGGFLLGGRCTITADDLYLDYITPFSVELRQVGVTNLRDWRHFTNGFQSWSPTGWRSAADPPLYPRHSWFDPMNHFVDSRSWRSSRRQSSQGFSVLQPAAGGNSILVGFITEKKGATEISLEQTPIPSLCAQIHYGGTSMEKADSFELEPLVFLRGEEMDVKSSYADLSGRAMSARIPSDAPTGWCSWYAFGRQVTEKQIIQHVETIAAHPDWNMDIIVLDDGYQEEVGDWLEINNRFPGGLTALSRSIRDAGKVAGIWCAPFFASRRSNLYRQHPDWFVKNKKGYPLFAGYNPCWNTRLYSLDLTHPEVLAWMFDIVSTFVKWGFDYFKMDFLFAGYRDGLRHDPRKSSVEAYRMGLKTIRDAIGPSRFLLGCGAPLLASVGMVDGMRISVDIERRWENVMMEWMARGCHVPCGKHVIQNVESRAFLHNRWWANDPDCILVDYGKGRISDEQVSRLINIQKESAGLLFSGDDLVSASEKTLVGISQMFGN